MASWRESGSDWARPRTTSREAAIEVTKGGVSGRRIVRILKDTARGWSHAASYVAASRGHRAVRRRDPSSPPHLALLARYLPPTVNGGVYRPTALMEAASARGWDVTAFCQPPPAQPTPAGLEMRARIPARIRLIAWTFSTLDVSGRFSLSLDGGFTNIAAIIDAARTTFGSGAPDLVLATGPTFAEFVAAMALAGRWGVPYALDYRDEWSECPLPFVDKGNSDRFWEARAAAGAGLVTFTTEAQRQHQLRIFPALRPERTAVIPNGWDAPPPMAPIPRDPPETRGRARIAFLGNLLQYEAPEFLRTLAAALDLKPGLGASIEVVFVGMKRPREAEAIRDFPVPGVVSAVNQVPLSEAQRQMRRADALLYLNPPQMARYVGGKAWEYMASGRPVLVYGEGGESGALLGGYPPALVVPRGDPPALAAALERIAKREDPPPVDPAFLENMSRPVRAGQHLARLELLLREPTGT